MKPDPAKIRIGYTQMQALVQGHRSPGSVDFPSEIASVVVELVSNDPEELVDNLFQFLFGAALFGSNLLTAVHDTRMAAKTDTEILRHMGQTVNLQLDIHDGPG